MAGAAVCRGKNPARGDAVLHRTGSTSSARFSAIAARASANARSQSPAAGRGKLYVHSALRKCLAMNFWSAVDGCHSLYTAETADARTLCCCRTLAHACSTASSAWVGALASTGSSKPLMRKTTRFSDTSSFTGTPPKAAYRLFSTTDAPPDGDRKPPVRG